MRHIPNREQSVLQTQRPKRLWEINNAANIARFDGRVCIDCRREIMNHWILPIPDPQKRALKYCYRDGTKVSTGIAHT